MMSNDQRYSQLDQDLEEFGEKWSIEHSIIWCQGCDASQAVDQAAEPFIHANSCENETRHAQHPWHELAALLRDLPSLG